MATIRALFILVAPEREAAVGVEGASIGRGDAVDRLGGGRVPGWPGSRAAAARKRLLILAKASSMGLKSGE